MLSNDDQVERRFPRRRATSSARARRSTTMPRYWSCKCTGSRLIPPSDVPSQLAHFSERRLPNGLDRPVHVFLAAKTGLAGNCGKDEGGMFVTDPSQKRAWLH